MKTNTIKFTVEELNLNTILAEAELAAVYNQANQKQALRLRLLTEELISLVPKMMASCQGDFWIENNGSAYELHLKMNVPHAGDVFFQESMLELSTTGKNIAHAGITGKIRAALEIMFGNMFQNNNYVLDDSYQTFYNFGCTENPMYKTFWSLNQYKTSIAAGENEEEQDELEKSILSNLADDVAVGISGKNVEIIVKKQF